MSKTVYIYEKIGVLIEIRQFFIYCLSLSFAGISFWFNYKFIDGNNFFDFIIFGLFILSLIGRISKFIDDNHYKGVSSQKVEKIKKILNKN